MQTLRVFFLYVSLMKTLTLPVPVTFLILPSDVNDNLFVSDDFTVYFAFLFLNAIKLSGLKYVLPFSYPGWFEMYTFGSASAAKIAFLT